MLYSVAAHVDRPKSIQHGLAAIGVVTSVLVIGILWPSENLPLVAVPANLVVFGTAWILGDNMRNRRAYLAELEDRAHRADEQRQAEARQAVMEERSRIARELHDVVAHSMSVMVVQAGAARRTMQRSPDEASEAIANIERAGRESLDEMRRILGVLRGDDEDVELAPAPDLSQLDQLTQHCEEAGLPVDVVIEGQPRALPTGLELSVYRVVQESLTNTLKHAGPATAQVRLCYRDDELAVEVVDDGRGAAAPHTSNGSRQGLVGMRERVEAYGGALHTGPRVGGGFTVQARFPVRTVT
jgi:signal transduction histidine kinase